MNRQEKSRVPVRNEHTGQNNPQQADSGIISQTLAILHPNCVFEVRALNVPGYKNSTQTWSGYYDEPDVCIDAVDNAPGAAALPRIRRSGVE